MEVDPLLHLYLGSSNLNSSFVRVQQSPLPAEPSYKPHLIFSQIVKYNPYGAVMFLSKRTHVKPPPERRLDTVLSLPKLSHECV